MTVLDRAFAAMEDRPDDDAARLRFFERLADAELFLLLERPATDDRAEPRLFPLNDGPVALAFDTEERLAAFAGAAPYVQLTGRTLSGMLKGHGIGLGLNLDVAPSAHLIPAAAIDWLAETLAGGPEEQSLRPVEFAAPSGLPEALIAALDAKLPGLSGLARAACLARVVYEDGTRGHMLGFLGAVPGAETALARAAREALVFSGLDAGALDVAILAETDPAAERLGRAGLRFDIPAPDPGLAPPSAPGMDPDRPPRLG